MKKQQKLKKNMRFIQKKLMNLKINYLKKQKKLKKHMKIIIKL